MLFELITATYEIMMATIDSLIIFTIDAQCALIFVKASITNNVTAWG